MTLTLELAPLGKLSCSIPDTYPAPTRQVLLVEDDLDIQEGLATFLRWRGYSVATAVDGARALRLIESEDIDLLILDLGLPGVHGLDVLHRMRELGRSIPTVVVTASSSVQGDLEARDVGADVVLAKPVRPTELVRWAEELLDD